MPLYETVDNFTFRAGAEVIKEVTFSNKGAPVDLTLYTVAAKFHFSKISGQSDLALTEGAGITINADPATGKFQYKLTDTESSVRPTNYEYSVTATDGSSNDYPIVSGVVTVTDDLS